MSDGETFGPLLHGTARAWRQKLDQRLKPMGLSQAKWRTLLHLSLAPDALTQAEIAARLGVEEPSVVTLLHRLEIEGWITRKSSPVDRRCKMVLLGRRAQRVIAQINAAADKLRHELLAGIPRSELQTCIKVLVRISQKAEKGDKVRGSTGSSVCPGHNGQDRERYPITKKKALRGAVRGPK
ncbi:MAG: MarR family transcriptional regulator [Verrucomicrobia bacterium]|nr:MAG: MarR family transcriptional regulator [Verrucomicrobiota bacterium]